jgi:hypothetical protein
MESHHEIYDIFYYIKINVFSFLVPTIDIMQICVIKGQTNMNSTNYRSLKTWGLINTMAFLLHYLF